MLDSQVLVLNRVFQAVHVTSVRKAFSLFYKGHVRAVLPDRAMCTDNAAMIAAAGWWRFQSDGPTRLDVAADPNLRLPVL